MKLSKELRHQVLKIAVPTLGISLFYAVGKSSGMRIIGDDLLQETKAKYGNVILAGWHEHVLTSTWTLRRRKIALLSSQSRDGEYLARLTHLLGYYPVRGSSSRGGVRGMRLLMKAMQDGHDVLIGPDGPRGPAKECKAGAVLLAKHSGFPIIPCAGHIKRFKRLKSWDRTIIPMPFTRFSMGTGAPILVPEDADKTTIAEYQIRVADAINALQKQIEEQCAT